MPEPLGVAGLPRMEVGDGDETTAALAEAVACAADGVADGVDGADTLGGALCPMVADGVAAAGDRLGLA